MGEVECVDPVDIEFLLSQLRATMERLDGRVNAAVEWSRSVANEVDVLPLLRALEVIPDV